MSTAIEFRKQIIERDINKKIYLDGKEANFAQLEEIITHQQLIKLLEYYFEHAELESVSLEQDGHKIEIREEKNQEERK